ncbi:MAG: PspA/IM30 family protein [Desulfobacterales bacterium]
MVILARLMRIFRADIHGVMDHLEDRGLLLKQHLRDMEESLCRKEEKLKRLFISRDLVKKDQEKSKIGINNIERDLAVAIKKEKDDIARMLIKKLKPLAKIEEDRQHHIDSLDQEITYFDHALKHQHLQYEQLKQKADAYLHRKEQKGWEQTFAAMGPNRTWQELSEEEVELELLQRKEMLKEGVVS